MKTIDELRKPENLEEKYKVAVTALRAIAGRKAELNEWAQSEAYTDVWVTAIKTLERLGESLERYPKQS